MQDKEPLSNEFTLFDTTRDSSQADINDNYGHRKRLLDRYIQNGLSSLHPHEILELYLTYSIPRHDTKPIARELLRRYNSINEIINAPIDELTEIKGLGSRSAALFPLIRDIIAYCLKERFEKQEAMTNMRHVEEYLKFCFGQRKDEYVVALFLDNANRVLKTKIVAEGTVNQCALYPRLIIEQALHFKATSFILAHNHPGGALKPSEPDWIITERLFTIGKLLEIPLLDHIIITKESVVSLRDFPRWPTK